MAKRKYVDWDSVEPLYRAGSLSNYEICKQYNADHKHSQVWKITITEAGIRKQAKAKRWKKNLADKVKERIKENLVRDQVRDANQNDIRISDQEIIKQAAEAGSGVVIRHRAEIKALLEHEDRLLSELAGNPSRSHLTTCQGKFKIKQIALTVKEKSATLKNLAMIRAQRINLEREAYNLNDPDTDDTARKQIALNEVLGMLPLEVREAIRGKAVAKVKSNG